MINEKFLNYLHSVYPELPIDINFIRGYSEDEIIKIERLYDIKVVDQLYDFLYCMGRCSGGFFGDYPLMFYRGNKTVRSHILSQNSFREDLCNLQEYDIVSKKPFLISFENQTQYFFVLTESVNPNLIYHYDENEQTVHETQWTFNEYIRNIINVDTRSCIQYMKLNFSGELLII